MKRLIQVMLGIYVIVFIMACFSLTGCQKYHGKSNDAPKRGKMDVQMKGRYFLDGPIDLKEMNDFEEADLVDDDPVPINVYKVTFYT